MAIGQQNALNNMGGFSNPRGINFSGTSVAPLDQPMQGTAPNLTTPISGGAPIQTPYTIPAAIPTGTLNSNEPGSLAPSLPKVSAPVGGTSSTSYTDPYTGKSYQQGVNPLTNQPYNQTAPTGSQGPTGSSTPTGLPSLSSNVPYPGAPSGTQANNLNAVALAGQMTPQEAFYNQQATQLRNAQLYGQVDPYAEAGFYNASTGVLPDLNRPDLAGRAPGTQGLYSNLAGIGAASAQQGYANALQQQGYGLQSASTIAGLTAPQQAGYGSYLYNPATGQQIQNGVSPITGGIAQGQINAGQNLVSTAQAIGKAEPVAQNLDTLINSNSINPTDLTYANGAINWLKSNAGTSAQQAAITEFNGQLNDLASTLAPALGIPGGATTDFKTSLGQSIVNGLQNGQSIQQSLQYFIQQAQAGAQGSLSGAQNPIGVINGGTSSGLYNF